MELAADELVIVGLNTDEFITKYKGKPPIVPYEERRKTILSFNEELIVVPNDQETGNAKRVILENDADLIVIGSDWARKNYVEQLGIDWDWLDLKDIGICYLNYTSGISSTEIKRRVNEK